MDNVADCYDTTYEQSSASLPTRPNFTERQYRGDAGTLECDRASYFGTLANDTILWGKRKISFLETLTTKRSRGYHQSGLIKTTMSYNRPRQ